MDLADVLAGLDDRPWGDVEHAYGSAEDVPAVLRALADDDPETAGAALHELYGNIWHQGTVYAATVEAVPYLARLAAAGYRSADVLVLLGSIAESEDEYGVPRGACRAAVAAQLPLVLPLLDAGDAQVRQGAAWVCGHAAGGERTWSALEGARPVLNGTRPGLEGTGPVLGTRPGLEGTGPGLEGTRPSLEGARPVPEGTRPGLEGTWSALERRWVVEGEPLVRAELLAAMVRLEPAAAVGAATAALDPTGPAELRLAGVLACLDAGLPWSAVHHDTVLALLPADDLVSGRFDEDRREPLQAVVDILLRRATADDREAAFGLLEAALALPGPDARVEAVWAADHACMNSRSAPGRLLPSLVRLLGDPSAAPGVLSLLGKTAGGADGGSADVAGALADALAGLATGVGTATSTESGSAADSESGTSTGIAIGSGSGYGSGSSSSSSSGSSSSSDGTADQALAVLVTVAPERAAPLLAADLPGRPRALTVAAGERGLGTARAATLPFAAELLDAVRRRLADPGVQGNESIDLTLLLTSWGTRASAAIPELLDALPRVPLVGPKALVALCPADGQVRDRVVDRLRKATRTGPEEGRPAAAHALFELTGDAQPLRAAIRSGLSGKLYDIRDAARRSAELGSAGAELAPALRAALGEPGQGRTIPRLDADTELAEALWRITGEADEAVRILASVLAESDGPWFNWTGVRAARLAAQLGPAARTLRPVLESMLDTPLHAPACALALLAIGVEDETRRALADPVLTSAEHNADPDTALEALTSLGRPALTQDHLNRLTALADGDRRVVSSGLEHQIIRADERLRIRARATLSALGGPREPK
ncbi:hypothetical protein [Streptomyces sp. KS_5]|uniref:hypothetical protein n=1 Tax=Streptomyces sp. KS_5 TaxID=1881018 RepID=UPI0008969E05|nr:hypothetical protein [Streptomyces sp. KS_5]SEC06970.1 hypothetical protein SAMN05428938_1159 [Streptomyces sp. KS_5]